MEDNRLIEGGVERGDAQGALAGCAVTAEGRFETAFVEHAYIEPEAGWARRLGDRVELFVSTQTPVMDRDMTAEVLGLTPSQVRIVPSACGGGFGGKLDVSIQPLTALAAWLTGAPVACVYERPESMMASTKRHPAAIEARFGCDGDGKLQAVDVRRHLRYRRLRLLGADRGEAACRSTPPAPMPCPLSRPEVGPSTPTVRRPAPFAASACRRLPSPTRR